MNSVVIETHVTSIRNGVRPNKVTARINKAVKGWNVAGNLITIQPGTSVIVVGGTDAVFTGGGKTYYSLSINMHRIAEFYSKGVDN